MNRNHRGWFWNHRAWAHDFAATMTAVMLGGATACAWGSDDAPQAAAAGSNWYNEPSYVNPGSEGLSYGLTPIPYVETDDNRFLGQYVCVDAADRAVPGDPFACTSSRRKLKIGEDLPYIRYTYNSAGKRASVSNSVPLAFNNRVRFVNTRHSGSSSRILRNYMTGDGYDITDNYKNYSFIYGTRDPVTTSEDFIWCGAFGQSGGGWMLWPNSLGASNGSGTFLIGGGSYGSCLPTSTTYTIWEAPRWIPMSVGRSLYAIKTLHFSAPSVAASDQLEVFYQNTLYGAIRWEAWKSTPQVDGGAGVCNQEPVMQIQGKTFYRKYCAEWTSLLFPELPFHPYHNPLTAVFTTSSQRLDNSDFVSGTKGWTLQFSEPGAISYATEKDATGNPYLVVNKVKGSVVSVSQTVSGAGGAAGYATPVLQGGVLLKGPVGAEGVVAVLLSSSKGATEERKLRFKFVNAEWAVVRFHAESVHLKDPNVRLTFRFYPKTTGGTYLMDEAFLAILPKSL